ncbi:YdiU family protein [Marinobacter sp. MDS2]|uniref:protein adenylyltransferase SelO n=1 Tax=Marinobacter sp. MDS2 TaxID=3065961 RepID=UPI00273ADC29|nr:protein adenylyltransferase SelO family protein [Marinobacter sp. MDS2]MDP4546196.1 protein adenylyltransferase SelO family protein [Marinobacter sp. MDS2]
MTMRRHGDTSAMVSTLADLAPLADYSFVDTMNRDPEGKENGADHEPRQVFSGHYVPVKPTPIEHPEYVAHGKELFQELGLASDLAKSEDFMRMFSGDLSQVQEPLRNVGWACGYALSIYGNEFYRQCPFQTGNGYGDGRAISVLEAVINGQRWEMQLKGGGRTPYCRGADGRAVLRSSVREFLAQEHMHALGVPTSRSLSLYVSKSETVRRPWYSQGSRSVDPDILVSEPVAITTRVAPSFIRVGQLELFGRRARKQEHPRAMEELEKLVLHLIEREYGNEIDPSLPTRDKVVLLAHEFRSRLTSLVANWVRVGYCQGNFNSDNCAAGGFTLDYGPFGFCNVFDPHYQPWTGGGQHFAFLNQPAAAERNFHSFCGAIRPLLEGHPDCLRQLEEIQRDFPEVMQTQMEHMWAAKLGLERFDSDLFSELAKLMVKTPVDYTMFFRELSSLPESIEALKKSFYASQADAADSQALNDRWSVWFEKWNTLIDSDNREQLSSHMKRVNPKYSLKDWYVVPAYQQAAAGDYTLLRELQDVMTQPYAEQTDDIEAKYYRLKPLELFDVGGWSHYSCSS